MHAISSTLRALVDPWDGVAPFIDARRWALPLVAVCLASFLAGAAWAWRMSALPAVLAELSEQGELQRATEQEISEQVLRKQRTAWVLAAADGVVGTPARLLALASALALVSWLLGLRVPFAAAWQVALVSSLPLAVGQLALAAVTAASQGLSEAQRGGLLPSHLGSFLHASGPREALLRSVDLFQLWSVGLMGLGLAQAGGVRRWKAGLLALVLFALFVAVFRVGLPGLLPAGPGGGR